MTGKLLEFHQCKGMTQNEQRLTLSFVSLLIRPRILVDVEKVTTETTILGHKINSPVCVAPTAFHGMAHDDAEKATARGTV
jgi:isopentenyl diphosphate isomerase/L-lactate dehydrogenase-like FMN-dependent dehydrogenase